MTRGKKRSRKTQRLKLRTGKKTLGKFRSLCLKEVFPLPPLASQRTLPPCRLLKRYPPRKKKTVGTPLSSRSRVQISLGCKSKGMRQTEKSRFPGVSFPLNSHFTSFWRARQLARCFGVAERKPKLCTFFSVPFLQGPLRELPGGGGLANPGNLQTQGTGAATSAGHVTYAIRWTAACGWVQSSYGSTHVSDARMKSVPKSEMTCLRGDPAHFDGRA